MGFLRDDYLDNLLKGSITQIAEMRGGKLQLYKICVTDHYRQDDD